MNRALCLNMIVKNEMSNLGRCLSSVVDHISCWVIADTGSTDGTPDFIRSFFDGQGVPGELHIIPFINYEQARNEALLHACSYVRSYDYLLLVDADMELVVEDVEFRSKMETAAYRVIQRGGGLSYWNTRLVRRDTGARYRGTVHEYIDVPNGTEDLHGIWLRIMRVVQTGQVSSNETFDNCWKP